MSSNIWWTIAYVAFLALVYGGTLYVERRYDLARLDEARELAAWTTKRATRRRRTDA